MSGQGKVREVFRTEVPNDRRDAIQLTTDAPVKECAIFIAPQDPLPAIGDEIRWTTGHVYWAGRKLRKLGYAFDPNAPLR